MKNFVKKISIVCLAIFTVTFVSCDLEDANDDETSFEFSAENNARAAQADNVVDGTLNIMENGYVEAEEGRNMNESLFPECVVITIQPNGNGGTIVFDFGEGCLLNNGAFVTGQITLVYGPFDGGTRTINYTFNDYTYNNNAVSGGGQIFRQIANADGNPQSTTNEAITVAFPNTDVTATRNGMHTTVWTEGVGSGTWLDNVYHVTGDWDTVFTNGFERTGLVTEALVRRLSCAYVESGTLEVTQEGFTGIIDWGDGTCDNMATLEVNGQIYDIQL
jgi:hypothetical protein